MERELDGRKIKYEDGKIWLWREWRTKPSYWWEAKGCVDKSNGYRRVCINIKQYSYHRLVYFLHNNDWDIHDTSRDNYIDHIDRDKLNNNIENLRVVTNAQNLLNTNAKGYSFRKARGKYQAGIQVDGKLKHLGMFVSEDDARNAYLLAKEKYHIF
tara:strand:- start:56 stop:523 length:468 start_codon:yes stop_codon:yes gene_type:complete